MEELDDDNVSVGDVWLYSTLLFILVVISVVTIIGGEIV